MLTNLDLHEVDGLYEPWLGRQHGGVDSPRCGDDLAAATVDGVSVQGHVVDVEPDRPQVLVTQNSLGQVRSQKVEAHNRLAGFRAGLDRQQERTDKNIPKKCRQKDNKLKKNIKKILSCRRCPL